MLERCSVARPGPPELTTLVATRAHGRRRIQRAPRQTDPHRPALRRWPPATFLFSGIVVRRFLADGGARASMACSLSRICGCRGRGLYPLARGADESNRPRDGTRAAGVWGSAAAPAIFFLAYCPGRGGWRAMGSSPRAGGVDVGVQNFRINHFRCPHARARRRRFRRALRQTDLHRPTARRCGGWPPATFLFSGIVGRRVLADDGARAIGADADVASPGRCGGEGAGERSELWGRRQRSPNSAALTMVALFPALSALRLWRHGKISGIWQN
jgi:hypothetical protein